MYDVTALIDSGADINILSKKIIPSRYWTTAKRKVLGLGKKNLEFEVSKAAVCFNSKCVKLSFAIVDIPVDCILGNIFLAAVEPHGSVRFPDKSAGMFITVSGERIEIPYVSNTRVSTMVQAMQ